MPGFKILDGQDGIQLPNKVVYSYTWQSELLAGLEIKNGEIYLREVDQPQFSYETETIKTSNASYEFPSGIKWKDIKVSFYNTDEVMTKLIDQSKRTWDVIDGLQVANDFMGRSVINVYYGDDELAYQWILENSWIKSVDPSKLTYEDSGMNDISVTLAYTWAIKDDAGLK